MTLKEIANIRLLNQQIIRTGFNVPKDLVKYMGAMQAQDYAMSKRAVGARVSGSTDATVETTIDSGEIIRTHLLRPTWHLVSADDIYWLTDLTAPQIKASMKSRRKELELTDAAIAKSNTIIENALEAKGNLAREELVSEFKKHKIGTENNRIAHLLAYAELDGIICSGATKGNKPTYALLRERVPNKKTLPKDEALAELAKRYFTSHGPATLQDFTWWSGLNVKDARNALEMTKPQLISEYVADETYWFSTPKNISEIKKDQVFLLPAYDEYIISYKDRTAALLSEHHKKVISSNGIFWPTVVIDGTVKGLWKRTVKKDKVKIEVNLFQPVNSRVKNGIEKAAEEFGTFLGKQAEVVLGE